MQPRAMSKTEPGSHMTAHKTSAVNRVATSPRILGNTLHYRCKKTKVLVSYMGV